MTSKFYAIDKNDFHVEIDALKAYSTLKEVLGAVKEECLDDGESAMDVRIVEIIDHGIYDFHVDKSVSVKRQGKATATKKPASHVKRRTKAKTE